MNDEDHDGHTINLGPPAGSPADERPKWDPREEDDWYPPHAPSTPVDAPPAPPVSPPVPERLPATVSCPDCRGSGMASQQHDYATEILGCEGCQGEGVLHVADLIAALVRLHASSPVNASIVRNITEALAPLAAADRGDRA